MKSTSQLSQAPQADIPVWLVFGWCIAGVAAIGILFVGTGFLSNATLLEHQAAMRTLGICQIVGLLLVIANGGLGRTRAMLKQVPGSAGVFLFVFVVFGIPIVYGCITVANAVLKALN